MPLFKSDTNYHDVVSGGCWNWKGALSHNGYGLMWKNGKTLRGPRYFYTKYKGEIPIDMEIDHLCKNRMCVNPDHLEAVSHTVNQRRRKITKLNEKIVNKIKKMYKSGTRQIDIAVHFNINQSNVSRIINNRRWSLCH